MNEDEQRTMIMDFERNRQMLGTISSQRQQFGVQKEVTKKTKEVKEDKPKKKKVVKKVKKDSAKEAKGE